MTQLIDQLILKMGLQDEPKIVGKTTELLRLLELRSANVSATLNVYAKSVICIDLAAIFLGIPFDQENALKLSSLRKTHYANNKRMLEKLLDLNKLVGVNDICIKLGLNEVSKRATELLELYKNVVENETTDIDITHPQYPAMAVYQACKIAQKRISKQKILAFSHLRPSQWSQLEQRWDKIIATHYSNIKSGKVKSPKTGANEKNEDCFQKSTALKRSKIPEVEDYEVWKRRMLTTSHHELVMEKAKYDKENVLEIKT